ncbi:MAG TPA: RNA methyltransferase [Crocinitomix sp.]|nr:RNA methyltransferase [Crocinitomix sp.]
MSLTKNEIKFIKSLHLKKNRTEHQLFIVEGEKLVNELIVQDKFNIQNLYITPAYSTDDIPNNLNFTLINDKDLDRISAFKTPNKVLAIVKQPNQTDINYNEKNLILFLDDIKDPGNLGTIIRTADWFGITQIIASKNTVELFNPKVIQASMGAIYRINYFVKDLLEELTLFKQNNFSIMGAVIDGEDIYNTSMPEKNVLIMGSESHGLSKELLAEITHKVSIPKFGKTESLNVAIATGVLLSEYKKDKFTPQKL